ncbi:hypothetical protein F4778DRAFT_784079 [Xylariomycetidae sp. FL2044]|nr:hypothetical protein F4778DRAFT_784079 [Xylariomycetidae sp. FL2044]
MSLAKSVARTHFRTYGARHIRVPTHNGMRRGYAAHPADRDDPRRGPPPPPDDRDDPRISPTHVAIAVGALVAGAGIYTMMRRRDDPHRPPHGPPDDRARPKP